jgi:hypothetical protein
MGFAAGFLQGLKDQWNQAKNPTSALEQDEDNEYFHPFDPDAKSIPPAETQQATCGYRVVLLQNKRGKFTKPCGKPAKIGSICEDHANLPMFNVENNFGNDDIN